MVGLEGIEKKMPSDLSGGMRKRGPLLPASSSTDRLSSSTTNRRPDSNPITARQINELIVKTQSELRGTSIIVTHDLNSAFYVADRIALHNEGKIAYVADPGDFMKIDDPIINFLRENVAYTLRKETAK